MSSSSAEVVLGQSESAPLLGAGQQDAAASSRSSPWRMSTLMPNIIAGLTVSLINIPLSVSLAVASQSTPTAGIITAVWAGLVAAVLGGSEFNITGPTGALAGILANYALLFGADILPLLSITSSLIIAAVYLLKWDKYMRYLPSSIVHGFTVGVAVIIASSQLSSALGIDDVAVRGSCALNILATLSRIGASDVWAVAVFACLWLSLFALIHVQPRMPWFTASFGYLPHLRTLGDKYGSLNACLWAPLELSSLHRLTDSPKDVGLASVSIAFVAVLESLISGKLADGLTHSEMDSGQEVLALAAANLACGVAGGLPATAALARTSLSIRSGATGRFAGIVSASLTGLLAVALLPAFSYLPLCVVAALLFQVAVGMLDSVGQHLVEAYKIDSNAFRLTLLVALLCVVLDPTAAILVGSILGLVSQAARSTAGYAEVITSDNDDGTLTIAASPAYGSSNSATSPTFLQQLHQPHGQSPVSLYRIVGDLSFLSSVRHVARLRQLHRSYCLIVSFRFCRSVDLDGLHQLHRYLDDAEADVDGRSIVLCGVSDPQLQSSLAASGWFERWQQAGKVMDNVGQAIDALSGQVAEADASRLRNKIMQAKGQRGSLSTIAMAGAV